MFEALEFLNNRPTVGLIIRLRSREHAVSEEANNRSARAPGCLTCGVVAANVANLVVNGAVTNSGTLTMVNSIGSSHAPARAHR